MAAPPVGIRIGSFKNEPNRVSRESTPHKPKVMNHRSSPMVKSFKGKIIQIKPEDSEEPDTNKNSKTKPIMPEPEVNASKDEILASYID